MSYISGCRWRDIEPGKIARCCGRLFLKIDPTCEFAQSLDSVASGIYGIDIETGVIAQVMPDNAAEELSVAWLFGLLLRLWRGAGLDMELRTPIELALDVARPGWRKEI